MQRLLKVALALLIMVSIVSPWSARHSVAAPAVKVTIWYYWVQTADTEFKALVSAYERSHPNVSITLVNVPSDQMQTKLQAAAAAHQLPNLAMIAAENVNNLSQTGQLADLLPYARASRTSLSDYYPETLSFGKLHHKLLALPVDASDVGFFYNKSVYKQAGLNPNKPPKTWAELTSNAKKIKAKTGVWGHEFCIQYPDCITYGWFGYLYELGGRFLNKSNTAAAFNSPAGRKAMSFWVDSVKQGISPAGNWGEFSKGRAGSNQDGSFVVSFWQGTPSAQAPFDFGTGKLPVPAGGHESSTLGVESGVVFKGTPAVQKAAADFLFWFTSPRIVADWSEPTGFLPVRKSTVKSTSYNTWLKIHMPALMPFVKMLPSAKPRPSIPQWPRISTAFGLQFQEAVYGKKTVQKALLDATKQINALLRG